MRFRPVFILCLVGLMAYFVADAIVSVATFELAADAPVLAAEDPAEPQAKSPGRPNAAQPPKVGQIIARNLFGPGALGRPVVAKKPTAPPKTKPGLGLDLLGTVSGGTAGYGAVILDSKARKQDYYRVGGKPRPELTVKEVRRNSVILASREGDILLAMKEDQPRGAKKAAPLNPRTRRGGSPATAQIRVSRRILEQTVANLPEEVQNIAVSPVEHGGKTGYRFDRIKAGSALTRLSLRQGDVIMGVDGEPLEGPDQLLDLYDSASDDVTLNLLRGGREYNVLLRFTD
jgi:type II secretory pathway component PulC